MTDKYFVYGHWTADTNELFYIGCGSKRRVKDATAKGRNKIWHEIVNKHGFESEVIISFDNREDALKEELYLQKINRPRACLHYGEGENRIVFEETRKKMSETHKGRKRRKHTKKTIEKRSEANKKPVINCRGEIFSSVKEAANHFNLTSGTSISACIAHPLKNKSAGKYPDGPVKWSFHTTKKRKERL